MKILFNTPRAAPLCQAKAHGKRAVSMQAAANFNNPSSLLPRPPSDDAAAFCNWPRSCPWPKQETAAQNSPRQPLQRLSASVQELFRAEDSVLPPDVEQLALFSDALEEAAEKPSSWWVSMWRYQGL